MKIIKATHWWQRAGGLLIRPKLVAGEVLWLQPCCSVHTFGMGYPIAVFFLDKSNEILKVQSHVPPNRIVYCLGARSVCEMLPILDAHCASVSEALKRSLSWNTAT
jgi:hypothetical protein